PAFSMEGIPRDMFMPLSMAVDFDMLASFISSQTVVPIMANWIMKSKKHHAGKYKRSFVDKVGVKYVYRLRYYFAKSKLISILYLVVALFLVFGAVNILGTDIMPKSEGGDFQLRLRMPRSEEH